MPRAEHCEGGRGKGGERVPSALAARRRAQSLLRWWLALRLPPRAELRAADEERTRVQRGLSGSSQRSRAGMSAGGRRREAHGSVGAKGAPRISHTSLDVRVRQ
eukprot:scaffold3290_cov123-Isochrysis_galbana.AAC.1